MYYFPKILKKLSLYSCKGCNIHKLVKICGKSELLNSNIDRYTYIGYSTQIVNADIGAFCSIASNCIIGQYSHPLTWVSTSPVFNRNKNILKKNFAKNKYEENKKILIGNDVWIGSNVIVKAGVKICDGAVIGMGAVLTKDVGAYEVWAGNPAKLIGKRFSDEVIDELLKIKWWKWTEDNLEKRGRDFNNVLMFLETYKIGE